MRSEQEIQETITDWFSECENDEEIIENGAYGFLGESLLTCAIDEEDTEDISVCFEPKEN